MVAIDEGKLDEVYQKALQIEEDIALETERLRRLTHDVRLKLKKEGQEIRALRKRQQAELLESARSIFQWASDFAGSLKGRKILSTIGEVIIYRTHYFDCKPREEKEYEAWLTCDHGGALRYREFCRGIMGRRRGKVLTTPLQMVNRLHPNYVLSAGDAITTGEVWKGIECAIKWREEIFDIRRQRGWWPPLETQG